MTVSTKTHARYRVAPKKARDLVGGTPVPSSLLQKTPPYPTGSSNQSAIATGTAYPTAPIPTSTNSTSQPIATPSVFRIRTTGTGILIDDLYLFLAIDNEGDNNGNLDELTFEGNDTFPYGLAETLFHLNPNGTLTNSFRGLARAFEPAYQEWLFDVPYRALSPMVESVCKIIEGNELRCVTGVNTVFHVCINIDDGFPAQGSDVVRIGPAVQEGCYPLTLLVEPFSG